MNYFISPEAIHCKNSSSIMSNVCIITTNKSPSILQSASSNSSIQILDPQTGSILSTHNSSSNQSDTAGGGGGSSSGSECIKISSGVGVNSIHPIIFNHSYTNYSEHVYIAYGNQYKQNRITTNNVKDDDDDMYAYLLVQGGSAGRGNNYTSSSTSSSSPKWKCKLPEYMTSNLITSPCGYYIIGGGKSGTCYCWSTLSSSTMNYDNYRNDDGSSNNNAAISGEGSELVSKWVAHYRSIKSIIFSDCGSYIITGGDDGIVNVWNLMDVVSSSLSSSSYSKTSKKNNNSIDPIQTWSEHHLPITSMYALPSSRIVSTSLDKQVVIMELFNGKTIAKINMSSATAVSASAASITTITADKMGQRLYLGSMDGVIYSIDLNTFAVANTAESATVISNTKKNGIGIRNRNLIASLSGSLMEETVLGMTNESSNNAISSSTSSSLASHVTEFRGHNRQISALALVQQSKNDSGFGLLVSGSVDGSIRVWDIRSRCCIHTIFPWSSANGSHILGQEKKDDKKKGGSEFVFPCSSITVIPRQWIENSDEDEIGGEGGIFTSLSGNSGRRRKRKSNNIESLADLIKPLQRFTRKEQQMDDGNNTLEYFLPTFIRPMKGSQGDVIEESKVYDFNNALPSTNIKRAKVKATIDETKSKTEIADDESSLSMKKEIEILREEVTRWQKVNNKLMMKLKSVSSN